MDSSETTFLTSREVADLVEVSASTVLGWVEQGLLRCHRTPGGHRRIAREDLAAFLRSHAMPMPRGLVPAPRVLIIDDDASFARTMTRGLARLWPGVQLEVASNGIDGLLRIGAFRPSIVLLDVVMPGMDGLEVCRRLKAGAETRGIVVVAITGRREPAVRDGLLAAGAAGVLEKPIKLDELRPFFEAATSGRHEVASSGRETTR
jgi:excisionase family DNA binding protein